MSQHSSFIQRGLAVLKGRASRPKIGRPSIALSALAATLLAGTIGAVRASTWSPNFWSIGPRTYSAATTVNTAGAFDVTIDPSNDLAGTGYFTVIVPSNTVFDVVFDPTNFVGTDRCGVFLGGDEYPNASCSGTQTVKVAAGAGFEFGVYSKTGAKGSTPILSAHVAAETPGLAATTAVASKTVTPGGAITPFTPVTTTGAWGAQTFTVSPSLPAGLSLNASTGQISGTPQSAASATTYTVTVNDSAWPFPLQSRSTFSLGVAAALSATVTQASRSLTVQQSAAFTPVTVTGGTGTLSYSVSPALPAGLSLNGSTGEISGTPTAASAAQSYTVTVADSATPPNSTTASFSLGVVAGLSTSVTQASRSLSIQQSAAFTPVTVTGGTGTLSYSVSPALPAGLSLNASTGEITGTPTATAAAQSYTITVTDSATPPNTTTAAFSLAVSSGFSASASQASRSLSYQQAVAFTPVTVSGGTGALTYAISPALPAGLAFNTSTGEVSGTPTASSAATTYTVSVHDSATPPNTTTASFSLTVNGPTSNLTLAASSTAPAPRTAVTLTATLSPASAGGTVTFRSNGSALATVALASGAATYRAWLPAGSFVVTAEYSGQGVYPAATSNAVTIVSQGGKPDPVANTQVRAIQAAQVDTAQRVGRATVEIVHHRLERLHDEVAPVENGIGIMSPSAPPNPTAYLAQQLQPKPPGEAGALFDRLAARRDGRSPGVLNADAPANKPAGAGMTSPLPFNIWTSGTVMVGRVGMDDGSKARTSLSGLAVGADTQVMPGLKAGVAVGFQQDSARFGSDGSRNDSTTVTGTAYASWRVFDGIFIDLLAGYGDLRFKTQRMDENAGGMIYGERPGMLLYGSLAASWEKRMGALRLTPYLRYDALSGTLKAYKETGIEGWNLGFQQSTLTSQSVTLGLRARYDFEMDWGTLGPTVRMEYRHAVNRNGAQMISYADAPSEVFAVAGGSRTRESLLGALGVRAATPSGVAGAIELLGLTGEGQLRAQGVRGSLLVPF